MLVAQTPRNNSAETSLKSSTRVRTRLTRLWDSIARWPVCSCLLGTILVGAACLRGYELATRPTLLPTPLAGRWVWTAIVEVEFLLGTWLIFGPSGRRMWIAALVVWTIFLCISTAEALEGATSCHCFGPLRADPRYTAIFDALCIAMLCLARPPEVAQFPLPGLRRSRNAIVGAVAMCGVALVAWSLSRQANTRGDDAGFTATGGTVLLSPEKWIDRPFVLGGYTDIGGQLDRGEWLVLFYHYDCEHCQRAVPRYLEWQETHQCTSGGRRLALVEMPPYAPPGERLVPFDTLAQTGRLSDSRDWFATAPLAVVLHDGIVRAVAAGDEAENPEWLAGRSAVSMK